MIASDRSSTVDVSSQIQELQDSATAELRDVKDPAALEQYRIKYLGTNGQLKAAMKWLGQVPREQKPALGQKLNAVKDAVNAAFEARKSELASGGGEAASTVDVTEPGARPQVGAKHLLMQCVDELVELFARMGFSVASGPEVEDEFHNFIALNIPEQHPARDPLDNFYLNALPTDASPAEKTQLLRTQTSTVQIRVMQEQKPPIRVVIPGRVYRPDTHDDTHLSMFHQLEALVVDKNVTISHARSSTSSMAISGPRPRSASAPASSHSPNHLPKWMSGLRISRNGSSSAAAGWSIPMSFEPAESTPKNTAAGPSASESSG
jgi:phenylalanyl-tRNA synthetase alpha chain